MLYKSIENHDPELYEMIKAEALRQRQGLELIPSENYVSDTVLEANGSILTNKYAEGYPGRRYYGGNHVIDEVESLAQARAIQLFKAFDYRVNVQAYSGSPANLAVFSSVLSFGDTVLSLELSHGGHLTHGSLVNLSGKNYNFVHYPLDTKTELIDFEVVEKLALEHKPKLIISGFSAYPRLVDFARFHEIAKKVGAISMADISHVSGLVASGVHPSPFPFTDIVTSTTHKTLRGPRGALIFSKPEYSEKIDKVIFPGSQGGPHEHTIAAMATAFKEAQSLEFVEYSRQVVKNAKAMASAISRAGIRLVSGGTDNHLVLVDLRQFGLGKGLYIEKALDAAGITVNKNTVPYDTFSPFYPSGVRLGSPALTTRGFKEKEMQIVGELISEIVFAFAQTPLSEDKGLRRLEVGKFEELLLNHDVIKKVSSKVSDLVRDFPVPGISF